MIQKYTAHHILDIHASRAYSTKASIVRSFCRDDQSILKNITILEHNLMFSDWPAMQDNTNVTNIHNGGKCLKQYAE